MPDESVHCFVVSPPYFGLRDYGVTRTVWGGDPRCAHEFDDETVAGEIRTGLGLAKLGERYRGGGHKQGAIPRFQITRGSCQRCGAWRGALGHEPSHRMYVAHLVEVFRHVRRVLRGDGTLWLNIGDSYALNSGAGMQGANGARVGRRHTQQNLRRRVRLDGLKEKDLIGVPWRVALALQDDGWYLRQDNIWHKPNCKPESAKDRTTRAHEYVFMLTRSERYFYDAVAIAEPAEYAPGCGWVEEPKGTRGGKRGRRQVRKIDPEQSFRAIRETRNKRTVWTIATRSFPEAHFATMPVELAEVCIKAGTSAFGCCSACGAQHQRRVVKEMVGRKRSRLRSGLGEVHSRETQGRRPVTNGEFAEGVVHRTVGWQAACACGAGVVPAVVCDPFAGAGTTGVAADALGRSALLIEVNPSYARMIERRRTAVVDEVSG